MSFALEFADSEVRDVVMDGVAVRVRLAAASVRDAQGAHGWLPGVTLAIAEAELVGDAAHAFGRLAEGRLRHAGRDIARPALPGMLTGDLELTLRFANGTPLTARGRSLSLSVADDSRFKEDLSC
jgi:hypothetical protein